ncbi:MarR family transcriptional regulator [Roseateles aquatilis]|jgi:MarR family transcriptional regulator, negative regulator of the multidrug operon emrRAB|uniref:MarR family transcriptional regulator n=2 Tax=Pseudomonadota TaxID=1224 RepID=A0A246JET0_9BURK|nr:MULTISPECIES: MarR family winged helix-turn-helix transcriptional regulator [Pseudomonadota]OWQ91166.1 MarR family transcriptional regulator [Roseateles aquatilis]TDK27265.1 MarR family transcriptional regulator [Luteimonas aestuarii]
MDDTPVLLERLGALIQQSLRDDAARHGLLPIHLQILAYLDRANRYSNLPIAVAQYFGITRGTVSQSLQLLERQGLIVKTPDPQHGRRIHLEPTAAGAKVLRDGWAQRLEQALSAMPSEAPPLADALRGLLTALQRQNGQRAFGVCQRCAHFLTEKRGARCGLTREPLAREQTTRICREWTRPADVAGVAVST